MPPGTTKAVVVGHLAEPAGPVLPSIDVVTIRLVELDGDVYFCRDPKPARQEQRNMVRSTVRSFLFLLQIDRRRNPDLLPPDCWMRGRSSCAFLTAPADAFEEGSFIGSSRLRNPSAPSSGR